MTRSGGTRCIACCCRDARATRVAHEWQEPRDAGRLLQHRRPSLARWRASAAPSSSLPARVGVRVSRVSPFPSPPPPLPLRQSWLLLLHPSGREVRWRALAPLRGDRPILAVAVQCSLHCTAVAGSRWSSRHSGSYRHLLSSLLSLLATVDSRKWHFRGSDRRPSQQLGGDAGLRAFLQP